MLPTLSKCCILPLRQPSQTEVTERKLTKLWQMVQVNRANKLS